MVNQVRAKPSVHKKLGSGFVHKPGVHTSQVCAWAHAMCRWDVVVSQMLAVAAAARCVRTQAGCNTSSKGIARDVTESDRRP